MESIKELADAIYREKVLRARATPPEEKLRAGGELYDLACRIHKDGIRMQFPDADDARVEQIFRERVALLRRLEEHQWKRLQPSPPLLTP